MTLNLLNRYVWLVDTIRKAGHITLDEINEKWLSDEISDGLEIPRRTFHKWRIAAEELFDLAIICDKKNGYKYYIENVDELDNNTTSKWLLNALSVNSMVSSSKELKDRILLEPIPSSQEFLSTVVVAMRNNHPLSIQYQSFKKKECSLFDVEPYSLKLFKQRWYLIARGTYDKIVRIYALDRIQMLNVIPSKTFTVPPSFNVDSFFHDSYGIMVDQKLKAERIVIKVSSIQSYYIRSLPLHHSQREINRDTDYCWFEITVQPTYDFIEEILSHLPEIEVLEPVWLRQQVAEKVKRMK